MGTIRLAARTLARTPGLTAVIVFTLAVGIGATTAVFSILEAVLLRPLPYADPERLVAVWEGHVRDRNLAKIFASYDATYLPARRAATIDPAITLRAD